MSPAALAVPLPEGTADNPELEDAVGDVQYHPAHTSGNHDYLDLLAAWITYLPANDTFEVRIRTESTEALSPPPRDFFVSCILTMYAALKGRENGRVAFAYQVRPAIFGDEFIHRVTYSQEEGAPGRPLKHRFELIVDAPGIAAFWIDRPVLQGTGEALRNFDATCYEVYYVGGAQGTYRNEDSASSAESFDLLEALPEQTASGETQGATETQPNAASSKTPSLKLLTVMFTFSAACIIHRRHTKMP